MNTKNLKMNYTTFKIISMTFFILNILYYMILNKHKLQTKNQTIKTIQDQLILLKLQNIIKCQSCSD